MLDYPQTVTNTWSLSFQQIEQQSPTAADLLRLCAFLAVNEHKQSPRGLPLIAYA